MYTWLLKGLSRVRRKFHARFLWGWGVVTPPGYQTFQAATSTLNLRQEPEGGEKTKTSPSRNSEAH